MKYAARYLLILSLLGIGSTTLYAQETEDVKVETSTEAAQCLESKLVGKSVEDTSAKEENQESSGFKNEAQLSLVDKKIILNGKATDEIIKIAKEEDTYFLPARFVVEKLLASYISLEDQETLRIRRQGTLVLIKNHAKVAQVNEEEVSLKHQVYYEEGRYYISAEDLKTLFDVEVEYNESEQCLYIKGEDRRPNHKPKADFDFKKKSFTEGEEVVVMNFSHDQDEDEIIAKKWCIGEKQEVTGEELSKIFNKPKVGTYTIGLQVQDARGLWSDWTYRTVRIVPNEAPVLKQLTTDKTSYAPGEAIKFNYDYTNEEGEAITNEKWMYRKSTQEEKLAVLGKPPAFFTEGDYVVTLQIDDAAGKRSNKVETVVHIEGQPIKSELEYRFNEGELGDRIDNFGDENYRHYEDAVISEEKQIKGTLIMSDSPETVKEFGVLYEDTLEGSGRVLIHHLNQVPAESVEGKKQKLGLVISNDSEEEVVVTLSNEAIKGPATDITRVGQKVVYDYLTGVKARTITLKPGEKQWIYSQNWASSHCISGMLDVETTGPVRFITAALTEDMTLEEIDQLKRLPADGVHISGTFDTVGIEYRLTLDGTKPTKLLLGDKGSDEWVNGTDVRTETVTQNKGNFGVSYYVTITAKEDMGIFLNSRGGGIQGAIKWEDGKVFNVPKQGILAQVSTRAAVIGTIKKGETKTFEYILPNGSSAPVLIGFVPKSCF